MRHDRANMNTSEPEPITITLNSQPKFIFRDFDIVVRKSGKYKDYSLVYHVDEENEMSVTAQLRRLNTSRFSLFRKIELKILRKLLKTNSKP